MRVRVKFKSQSNIKQILAASRRAAQLGIMDCANDLLRAASGAAPHDEGILDSSGKVTPGDLEATVSFSAVNDGFDYAWKMHEGHYKLGPGSLAKPGGVGMSGANYPVGPKYLERPARGEESKYAEHIADKVGEQVQKFK